MSLSSLNCIQSSEENEKDRNFEGDIKYVSYMRYSYLWFCKMTSIHHIFLCILISTQIENLKQKKMLKQTMKSCVLIKRISFVDVQRQNLTLRVILVEVEAVKPTNLIVVYCKKQSNTHQDKQICVEKLLYVKQIYRFCYNNDYRIYRIIQKE